MTFLNTSLNWFLDALFPPCCIICRKGDVFLCETHQAFPPPPVNQADFHHLDNIHATTQYKDPTVEKVVEYFKFQGFQGLAPFIAQAMIEKAPPHFFENAVIVPIPLHWTRRLWRGFNQSELLAQEIHHLLPEVPVILLLKRPKRTQQQAQLHKKERTLNVSDAFAIDPQYPIPQRIILIDDVVASGATLDSAAKVLKSQGAKEVVGLVFARGGGN